MSSKEATTTTSRSRKVSTNATANMTRDFMMRISLRISGSWIATLIRPRSGTYNNHSADSQFHKAYRTPCALIPHLRWCLLCHLSRRVIYPINVKMGNFIVADFGAKGELRSYAIDFLLPILRIAEWLMLEYVNSTWILPSSHAGELSQNLLQHDTFLRRKIVRDYGIIIEVNINHMT